MDDVCAWREEGLAPKDLFFRLLDYNYPMQKEFQESIGFKLPGILLVL